MSGFIFCLLFAMQISLIYSAYPQIYGKCMLWDGACFTRQIQLNVRDLTSGINELGIEVLDPLRIDYAHIDIAGLKLDLSDAEVRGYSKSIIDTARVNPLLKQMHLVYHTDLSMESKYNAGGDLLGIPIIGDGNMKIKAKNVQIESIIPFEIVRDARGKYVIDLKNVHYWTNFKDDVRFELTNLFNGNKELSDSMHEFINKNSKLVSLTFSRPLLDIAIEKLFKAMRVYLHTVSFDDVFQ